jgi:hypothetical protein
MTPLLIFMGVPSAVAVVTQANQLVGASVSGAISHWRRGSIDMRMGLVLLAGGLIGSTIGVWIFGLLRKLGQLDLVISLLYVVVLGAVGSLMFAESLRSILRTRRHVTVRRRLHQHYWLHRLPFKMRFPKSRLYISAITPATIGVLGGFIVAIMGVGGGFFMVPAMIYIVGMPTASSGRRSARDSAPNCVATSCAHCLPCWSYQSASCYWRSCSARRTISIRSALGRMDDAALVPGGGTCAGAASGGSTGRDRRSQQPSGRDQRRVYRHRGGAIRHGQPEARRRAQRYRRGRARPGRARDAPA